jgi:hypothetical protein
VKQSLIGGMDDTRFRKYIEMTYYLVVFTSATGKILLLRYSQLPLVFPPYYFNPALSPFKTARFSILTIPDY